MGRNAPGYQRTYHRARSRAIRRLIDRHRAEYEQLLAEERENERGGQ
jgi:hypothetical protein